MRSQTMNALLARGFPSDLIAKIETLKHTLSILATFSKTALRSFYTDSEVALIEAKIKRTAIPVETLERVIQLADSVCCYCKDGVSTRPYQIHHAIPYAATQDDSEDNLLLICPTHHEVVAKNHSPDRQKSERREWHALVAIAQAYRAKGIPFPYGTFVAVDYGYPPDVAELILRYHLTPSTALAVTNHELGGRATAILDRKHFLLILGGSGDGKTTLANGIAGVQARRDHLVFRYRPSSPADRAITDVLTFLAVSDRSCILILDDANGFLNVAELEEIQAATGSRSKVIATWTRDGLGTDPKVERHFPDWLLVNWEALRDSVRGFLLSNEQTVTDAIGSFQDGGSVQRVGIGHMDRSLESHIGRFERDSKTVSEFMFLIRGGSDVVVKELDALIDEGRADAPVLYAATEQIADFERPVPIDEVVEAMKDEERGGRLPRLERDWTEAVFAALCRRGRMQVVRGAYTTIHRDWARRLIGAALGSNRSRPTMEKLLRRDFTLDNPRPVRLMRLWSWLQYDDHGGPFIRSWAAGQVKDQWSQLVGNSLNDGLHLVGAVADQLHSLYLHDHDSTVASSFLPHKDALERAVLAAGPEDWQGLRALFTALDHACPDFAAELLGKWRPSRCAEVLGNTPPGYLEAVDWFFSGVSGHSPQWVEQVGRELSLEAFLSRLAEAGTGDIEAIFCGQRVLSRLNVPLLRSTIRRCAELMGERLAGAELGDLKVGVGDDLILWDIFADDLQFVFSRLDPSQLAEDLVNSRPREWTRLSMLSFQVVRAGASFFAELIDRIDDGRFISSIQAKSPGHEYEFRCLLWFLALGEDGRRVQLGEALYIEVKAAAERCEAERPNLLTAFSALHHALAEQMATELGLVLSENPRHRIGGIGLGAGGNDPLMPMRQYFRELDQSGEDYVVDFGPFLGNGSDSSASETGGE